MEENTPTEKIEWVALEHAPVEHGADWYWIVSIVAVCFALVSIFFKNFLFVIIIAIGSVVLMIQAKRHPEEMKVVLTTDGIRVDNDFYPYKNLLAYSIWENHDGPQLILHINRYFFPRLHLSLKNTRPERVHNFLSERVQEEEHQPNITDSIGALLGF